MKDLPKIFHFIWIGEGGPPPDRKDNPRKWQELNPDWEVWVWDYEKLRKFVKDNFPKLYQIYVNLDQPVKQSDMARPMLLYVYGGAYIDYDLVPRIPIRSVWDSGKCYNRCWEPMSRLPDEPAVEYINYDTYKVIFCKENQKIDTVGYGIGNNFFASAKGLPCWAHFLDQQKDTHRGLVLNFMGPWALTRFVRSKFKTYFYGKGSKCRAIGMPNHYFLYEIRGYEPPDYCVSTHPAVNTWGDHTKTEWWKV